MMIKSKPSAQTSASSALKFPGFNAEERQGLRQGRQAKSKIRLCCPLSSVLCLLLLLALLPACRTGPARPPAPWEAKLFQITTNWTPEVHVLTQVVTQTVTVPVILERTNVVQVTNTVAGPPSPPLLEIVHLTNFIEQPLFLTNVVTLTNLVPAYIYAPNATAKALEATGGTAVGLAVPGSAGIATLLLGLAFGAWGQYRSNRSGAAAAVLAQVIETGSELMKTTPQGGVLAEKWKTWMIQHQAEQGVIEQVAGIVGKVVDNESAREAAAKLAALTQTVKTS